MSKKYSRSDLMKLAIEEHLKCCEFPRVGVVISKSGEVLSTGYRGETRGVHAERVAIRKLTNEQIQGSTVFTTLEPCVELHDEQEIQSCAQLLIESGVNEVVIGVLDPNGTIYSQGYRRLLENNINVSFFNRKLRAAVEEETFEFCDIHKIYGCGKRRMPVVHSGTSLEVQFSEKDPRIINIKWATLQPNHGCVDLSSNNGAVRVASGARNFGDITDPMVFRFPSHFARMKKGMIAIVKPSSSTFCVLIQLIEIFESDIIFRWEVRNDN
ncbi:CMP deaminase [Azotobacter beijerinckii]|uniref:Diaminohydroxyphosphoribosylaminopyrimidine deaminase n=1 Tax=Azotobacter beijerinckii TaxID=170623 RepID=A0A1I3ZML1_9GAMM|nr:CMP deaminase [Azotobacter beijerinckii]SFB58807.1 diaminohydroxyphosphoribosylaminopyrimidine deaminase [Azotobacter beijerinckii]SFK44876.1 diaminohydroxyphosphoribosylaminopyrimidine deaminase [Azotobacter beijerinckii]